MQFGFLYLNFNGVFMQIDEIQFDIIMYLPKTTFLTFEEFNFRLENTLIAYQQCFNPNIVLVSF